MAPCSRYYRLVAGYTELIDELASSEILRGCRRGGELAPRVGASTCRTASFDATNSPAGRRTRHGTVQSTAARHQPVLCRTVISGRRVSNPAAHGTGAQEGSRGRQWTHGDAQSGLSRCGAFLSRVAKGLLKFSQ